MNAIVILNYNTSNDTINCYKSIRSTYGYNIEVIIVDNKSTDDSFKTLQVLLENEKHTCLLTSDSNKGYAAGNNIGIKKALELGVDGIIISNSDIIFLDNSIKTMIEFANSKSEYGIVAPKTLDKYGKSSTLLRKKSLTLWSVLLLSSILKSVFKKTRLRYIYDATDVYEPMKIDVVSGSCFYIKSKVISEIGLLDENTFLFAEEYILERKLSRTSFESYYLPISTVVHNHGTSTKQNYNFSYTKSVQSLLYYCSKYLEINKIGLHVFLFVKKIEFIKRNIFKNGFLYNLKTYNKTIKKYYRLLRDERRVLHE